MLYLVHCIIFAYVSQWTNKSHLPDVPNAVPFAFILYADKTWLSSHGTVKAYSVMAWCANLPIDIWNGERFGGGCIVGWLLIISIQFLNFGLIILTHRISLIPINSVDAGTQTSKRRSQEVMDKF